MERIRDRAGSWLNRSAPVVLCLVAGACAAPPPVAVVDGARERRLASEVERRLASDVVITRDDWGIAHVHGRTDAGTVFGAIYAQAEDDFGRIERNEITALGRAAEADGAGALPQDLRARLFVDPADLRARYENSPDWLRALMEAWADGLNFFLSTHPAVHPRVIARFEPWMALAFTEGSIGGDIERIPLPELARFYGLDRAAAAGTGMGGDGVEPGGSNGIAIAPARTRDGRALLLINPHTSFFFRSELQMSSDQGLDAYGAATWGQFFIYQGFNERLGWMHTSSHSDAVDRYLETVVERNGVARAWDGGAWRPVGRREVVLRFRGADGAMARRTVTVLDTRHGPVVGRAADGRWISEAMMFRPVPALEQAWELTKARNWREFMAAMALQANTSNDTVYADADGHVAFLQPQFVPRRDDRFDFTLPRDGGDPRQDWHGLHALDELPRVLDPPTGFIQNTNDWPYSAAGSASPRRADFPRYMDTDGENVRGLHALALLRNGDDFTLEGLVAAAFDGAQPGFDILIPPLLAAYDRLDAGDPRRRALAEQVAVLRNWDRRWGAGSVATTLAVYWGEALWRTAGSPPRDGTLRSYDAVLARTNDASRLAALAAASADLERAFGDWRVEWGAVNRFQRLDDAERPRFSDAAPSIPVPFTSGQWGSLASIDGPRSADWRRRYGDRGNSFVAAVEFGPRVRAVAVTAGGESGDPRSPHFDDQAGRYASGALRPVYLDADALAGHVERRYHPGE